MLQLARPEVTETPSPGVILIAASVVADADADAEASDELLEAESSSLPQAASIKSAAAEQEDTLSKPPKERKLSDKAKQRRATRSMRAEGDPDAAAGDPVPRRGVDRVFVLQGEGRCR